MKKLVITVAILIGLTPLLSFYEQNNSDTKDNKIGVWKTYQDYINGNLTDLGAVTENHNSWSDHGIFFDKEHVMPKETKYWGARVPTFHLKPHSFVHHDIPDPNTSIPVRFFDGKEYHFVINPTPIGIFNRGGFTIHFDSNDDVESITFDGYIQMWATKGNGDLIEVRDKETCRDMFDDDKELQKQYDDDEVSFKGYASKSTKDLCTFMKYVRKYNRKHGKVGVEKKYFATRK